MPMTFRRPRCSLLAFLAILGCPAEDAAGVDGSTGGEQTSGDTTGTRGDALDPTPACEAYIECAAEHAPAQLGELIEAYGPSGTCWQGGADLATTCDNACQAGLEDFEDAFGPGACEPPGGDGSAGDVTGNADSDLEIDLGDAPCVLFGSNELSDFIVGDSGAPVACEPVGESGGGRLPEGLSVDSSCAFAGTITEDRLGGWAQIVRVSQGDAEQLVPFCAVRETTAEEYMVEVTPSALMQGSFAPGESVAFGGAGEPHFTITSPPGLCGETSCFFGFAFSLDPSPFDAATFDLTDRQLAYDRNEPAVPIGIQHGIEVSGPSVAREYEDRPWVLSFEVDYCFSMSPDDCDGVANADDAFSAFALIMRPAE
jgi:hypothetical protein